MNFSEIIKNSKLRVTPQRVAVLKAVYQSSGHPSAEKVIDIVRREHPNIATGTIYNILESFVAADIIKRVKTDKGVMLYDAVSETHHHLYCHQSDRIEDFFDTELDQVLKVYFEKKKIEGFEISDIKLQLVGRFKNKNNSHK